MENIYHKILDTDFWHITVDLIRNSQIHGHLHQTDTSAIYNDPRDTAYFWSSSACAGSSRAPHCSAIHSRPHQLIWPAQLIHSMGMLVSCHGSWG